MKAPSLAPVPCVAVSPLTDAGFSGPVELTGGTRGPTLCYAKTLADAFCELTLSGFTFTIETTRGARVYHNRENVGPADICEGLSPAELNAASNTRAAFIAEDSEALENAIGFAVVDGTRGILAGLLSLYRGEQTEAPQNNPFRG